MKAITITQALKDLNSKLFKNFSIGSIRQMNIPNSFYSPTHEIGQRTDGYHTLSNSIHESDGFYDVVTPVYDVATQKLGAIFFDVDNFTFSIVALTQVELDSKIKDEFKNNLEGVFAFAITPDGTKEYAIKIGDDGKIVTVLIP